MTPYARVMPQTGLTRDDLWPTRSSSSSMKFSYGVLLLFLLLLYVNLPLLFPRLELVRPALLTASLGLLLLIAESALGKKGIDLAWPVGWLLLAILGAAFLSVPAALWPRQAAGAAIDLTKIALIFFLIINAVNTRARQRGLIWAMVLGGVAPALGALHNYATGHLLEGRANWIGVFANPNDLAYSLAILLPLAWALAWRAAPLLQIALVAISLLYVAAIFVTFSRGGILGAAVAVSLYTWRRRSIALLMIVAMLGAASLPVLSSRWTRKQNFSGLEEDLTFRQRLATSEAGLEMFIDHPLVGVGLGCSMIAWPLYAPENIRSRGVLVTHNTLIEPLSETGIIGFVPFVLFIGWGLYQARKLSKSAPNEALAVTATGLEVALWAFAACGLSGAYAVSWFPYILVALVASTRRLVANP